MLIDGAIASKKDVAHYASTTNRKCLPKKKRKIWENIKNGPRLLHKENKGKKLTPFP